jgi:hypothetical protein
MKKWLIEEISSYISEGLYVDLYTETCLFEQCIIKEFSVEESKIKFIAVENDDLEIETTIKEYTIDLSLIKGVAKKISTIQNDVMVEIY